MSKKVKNFSKKIIAKLCKIFGISALVTAFGGTSCSDIFPRESACLYGVPGNIFNLEGEVTDEKGNAIQGIQVNVKVNPKSASKSDSDSLDEEIDSKIYLDTEKTDKDGKFALHWHCQNENYEDFILEVKDIDDIENGYFNDTSESVSFRSDNRNGKSDFGNIIYDIKDKKIQLTEKKLLK